ncbi:MAG: RnfABCDGE type electron transport complex subunit D [Enterobacterales bacterium]|nr:RnfABCDGE type electron transport complex subunit D [Enterobacterales bacterium]
MATPLDESKTAFQMGLMTSEIIQDKHFELNYSSWMWINLAFLAGGISLLFNKIIQWQIPFSVLLSMGLTASVLYFYDDQIYLSASSHWLLGATMLGAFFIATDPVTASTTTKGRIIYGALIGFFIIIIRTFGGYPDAVAFSVLLINIAVPTIDHYTKPRTYGHQLLEENDV